MTNHINIKIVNEAPSVTLLVDGETVNARRHSNGGGCVALTAEVAESAFVAKGAFVLGRATVCGRAKIEGLAVVRDKATVSDGACVRDWAIISGEADVDENATVRGYATVSKQAEVGGCVVVQGSAAVTDGARVKDRATIEGGAIVRDFAIIEGAARVTDAEVGGYAHVGGRAHIYGDSIIESCHIYSARAIGPDARIRSNKGILYGTIGGYEWASFKTKRGYVMEFGGDNWMLSKWRDMPKMLAEHHMIPGYDKLITQACKMARVYFASIAKEAKK